MKKILIVCLALLLLTPTFVQAASVLHKIYFLGRGIAVSPSDPLDFMMVKVGLGAAKPTTDTVLRVGVMILDEQKYRIKEVSVANGSATGNLYLNGTQVGSFDVLSVMKGDAEVWAGTLTLDGTTYHLYILNAPRKVKPAELKDKVKDYCAENTDDVDCKEKVNDYCQDNPDAMKCKEVFRRYCQNNLDDSRCREFIFNYCKDRPMDATCRLFAVKRSAEFCDENPDSKICQTLDKAVGEKCEDTETGECKTFCEKYPNRCRLVKAISARVRAQISGTAEPDETDNAENETED
jgi:hypothetical protein